MLHSNIIKFPIFLEEWFKLLKNTFFNRDIGGKLPLKGSERDKNKFYFNIALVLAIIGVYLKGCDSHNKEQWAILGFNDSVQSQLQAIRPYAYDWEDEKLLLFQVYGYFWLLCGL